MMAFKVIHSQVEDPVELLDQVLESTWRMFCITFDACASQPDLDALFSGAELTIPGQAAKTVAANMLMEIMESVSRFSAWYKKPSRAYGLTSVREPTSQRLTWTLAPEACQRWHEWLEQLAIAIRKNIVLIQATLLVGSRQDDFDADPEIKIHCNCQPPRTIQIHQSVLDQGEIVCEACAHPFT
jgi:hypothetical protein